MYLWAALVAFGMAALALLPLFWALVVVAGLLLLAITMTAAGPLTRRLAGRSA